MISRRLLSTTTAMGAIALAAGCTSTTASAATSDIQTLAAGVTAIEGDLPAAGVAIPAATLAQVTTAVADINSNAAGIGTAVTVSPTTVATINTDVNLFATLLSPFFPEATFIGIAIEAVVSLIGTIVAETGAKTAAAAPGRMSAAKARLVLKAAAIQ
jgi:hypothetical protein